MPSIPTREQLLTLFSEDQVLRVPREMVPSAVTHAYTRMFLSNVGLPRKTPSNFLEIASIHTGLRVLTAAEPFAKRGREIPQGYARHYYLGEITGGHEGQVILDGTGGTVFFLSESGAPAYPLSTNVGTLAYIMYVLRRDKFLYSQEHFDETNPDLADEIVDTYQAAAERIRAELIDADPAALATEGNPWDSGLVELAAGMWG